MRAALLPADPPAHNGMCAGAACVPVCRRPAGVQLGVDAAAADPDLHAGECLTPPQAAPRYASSISQSLLPHEVVLSGLGCWPWAVLSAATRHGWHTCGSVYPAPTLRICLSMPPVRAVEQALESLLVVMPARETLYLRQCKVQSGDYVQVRSAPFQRPLRQLRALRPAGTCCAASRR